MSLFNRPILRRARVQRDEEGVRIRVKVFASILVRAPVDCATLRVTRVSLFGRRSFHDDRATYERYARAVSRELQRDDVFKREVEADGELKSHTLKLDRVRVVDFHHARPGVQVTVMKSYSGKKMFWNPSRGFSVLLDQPVFSKRAPGSADDWMVVTPTRREVERFVLDVNKAAETSLVVRTVLLEHPELVRRF